VEISQEGVRFIRKEGVLRKGRSKEKISVGVVENKPETQFTYDSQPQFTAITVAPGDC